MSLLLLSPLHNKCQSDEQNGVEKKGWTTSSTNTAKTRREIPNMKKLASQLFTHILLMSVLVAYFVLHMHLDFSFLFRFIIVNSDIRVYG